MRVNATFEFDFTTNVEHMREDLLSEIEIKKELESLIRSGEFFSEDVIECEVMFIEQ